LLGSNLSLNLDLNLSLFLGLNLSLFPALNLNLDINLFLILNLDLFLLRILARLLPPGQSLVHPLQGKTHLLRQIGGSDSYNYMRAEESAPVV
jgi:hypothetical protein